MLIEAVVFFKTLDYNCQIMAHESYPEPQSEIDQYIDDAFLDYTDRSSEGRIGMAAFELVEYIDEEREASMDMFRAWAARAKETPRMAFVASLVPTAEELTAKELRVKRARQHMHSAMVSVSEFHSLSYREIKKAEALARLLDPPVEPPIEQ